MTKCNFCRYGKMQKGKFDCTADSMLQQIIACEEAIKKLEEMLRQIKINPDVYLADQVED